MKKPYFCQLLSLLLFPFAAFLQTNDNVELKKMVDEDQNSRKAINIDWKELSKNDSIREKRLYELINFGRIITGQDYFNSALIFQHGRDSVTLGIAVKQMKKPFN